MKLNILKNKINGKKFINYLLVFIWMGLIFKFSSDPATVSDGKSGFVIKFLTTLGIDLNSFLGQAANFAVRKAAHFSEYFILSMLTFNALRQDFNKRTCLKLSILVVFLYACSDEFHQLFVPGRSGQFRDVLIDTCGGTLGALIFFITSKNKR